MRPLLLLLVPLLLICEPMLSRTQVHMGTLVTLMLPQKNAEQFTEVFEQISALEDVLSSYDTKALVYRLNHIHKISYDYHLADVIKRAKNYHHLTDGHFDITIGSISKKLYRFGEENNTIPTKQALKNATLNINAIEINATHITTKEGITVDLGGIGKGYTVDQVANTLLAKDITQGTVALSGDIRCLGRCDIPLQSPFEEDETFTTLASKIDDLSISTSGTYRRYVKNKEHHHLINPKTKRQGRAFVSVTILAKANNTLCDAMATAISVMPKQEALAFVKSQNDFAYLLVDDKGEEYSGNLEKFVTRKKSKDKKQ